MSASTGVDRLDTLLGGGLPTGSALLIHGPRFSGKGHLARGFLARGLHEGRPAILLHTVQSAAAERERLQRLGVDVDAAVEAGDLHFIDAATRLFDGPEDTPGTRYVDSPMDLNGIAVALNEAQQAIRARHAEHTLAIDSISTLLAHGDPRAAFRFLQAVLGRARIAGATAMVTVDAGMHEDRFVQSFRHLVQATIDTRAAEGKHQMLARGFAATNLGWVDYDAGTERFDLTGSFAAGRIR